MIFRRPYAFLIKHFRLIHIIISVLMGFLVYKSSVILSYFNEYISDGWLNNSNILIKDYLTINTFLIIILTMIFLGIVLALLVRKKKPIFFYVFSIATYVALVIVYLLVVSDMNVILSEILDPRKVRVTRDLVLIVTVLQYINLIFSVVRSTGFNIKKFDFEKDLRELNISDSDNEEIELTVEINTDKIRRGLSKRKRRFRYFILENMFGFVTFLVIVLTGIGIYIFLSITVYNKIYIEGQSFKVSEGIVIVNDSYYTTTDYKGDSINAGNYGYIVVDFSIKNNNSKKVSLNLDNFVLRIGDTYFSTVYNKYLSMSDFGEGYDTQILDSEEEGNYIVVFEVPINLNVKNTEFKYVDSMRQIKGYELETDYKNVKLNLKVISSNRSIKTYSLGAKAVLSTGEDLIVNSYDINRTFVEGENVIKANTLTDYDKILLKLNISYDGDIKELIKFMNIQYEKNGEKIFHNVEIIDKTPKGSSNIYFEVLKKLENSDYIALILDTRRQRYVYKLVE